VGVYSAPFINDDFSILIAHKSEENWQFMILYFFCSLESLRGNTATDSHLLLFIKQRSYEQAGNNKRKSDYDKYHRLKKHRRNVGRPIEIILTTLLIQNYLQIPKDSGDL
jgi:hypothetical protein